MSAAHYYHRDLDSTLSESLHKLAQWVPPGATVLELGAASGYFSRFLAERLGCTVDAVEVDPQMAAAARPWCRKLVEGNLDVLELGDAFSSTYDVVVAADVVEHLRDPARLLGQLPARLNADGTLLVSVPNVGYAGLILDLIQGEFAYRPEGLLDRSHLRFFTRSTLRSLIEEAGFFAAAWDSVFRPLGESEFSSRLESAAPAVVAAVLAEPDALCYQILLKATTRAPQRNATPAPALGRDRFPVRVFWQRDDGSYDYGHSTVAWGVIGEERQVLRFDVPAGASRRMRVRLADRPAYVRLHEIRLRDASGALLWVASGCGAGDMAAAVGDVRLCAAGDDGRGEGPEQGCLAVVAAGESWMELSAPAQPGSALEIELGWPMSSDYRVARRGWEAATLQLQGELDRVKELVGERDEIIRERDENIRERDDEAESQRRLLADFEARFQVLAARLAATENTIDTLTAHNQDLAARNRELGSLRGWLKQFIRTRLQT